MRSAVCRAAHENHAYKCDFYEALAGHCSLSSLFNTLSEENNKFCKKGQFINV
jgi:hypothetical protein